MNYFWLVWLLIVGCLFGCIFADPEDFILHPNQFSLSINGQDVSSCSCVCSHPIQFDHTMPCNQISQTRPVTSWSKIGTNLMRTRVNQGHWVYRKHLNSKDVCSLLPLHFMPLRFLRVYGILRKMIRCIGWNCTTDHAAPKDLTS